MGGKNSPPLKKKGEGGGGNEFLSSLRNQMNSINRGDTMVRERCNLHIINPH